VNKFNLRNSAKKFGAISSPVKAYVPTLLLFTFIVLIIVLADLGKDNIFMQVAHSIKHGDKIAHFLLYGMLAYLLNRGLKFRTFNHGKVSIYLGSAIVLFFAIVEEFSQLAFDHRTFDWMDMLCDLVGIWICSAIPFLNGSLKNSQTDN
jgi:polysaccharide biosynthesis protein VpsQ